MGVVVMVVVRLAAVAVVAGAAVAAAAAGISCSCYVQTSAKLVLYVRNNFSYFHIKAVCILMACY